MVDEDDARRVLGVGPHADRIEIRSAYRRRIRALHPDVSGDETPANHAEVAVVVEAFQLLQGTAAASAASPGPRPGDAAPEPLLHEDGGPAGPSALLVQRAMAAMIVVTASVVVVFFLIAFSQSGR